MIEKHDYYNAIVDCDIDKKYIKYVREYDLSKMNYKDLTYSGISFVYAFAKEDFTFDLDLFLDTHSKDGYTCK